MDIQINYSKVGSWKENSYCISLDNDAWLIDPGDEFDLLKEKFKTDSLAIRGIINTHGHFDHLGAAFEFQELYNLPFYIHSKDKRLVHQANLYRKLAGNDNITRTPRIDGFVDDFDQFELAGQPILIHFTPGHSSGSVCFEISKNLFSGDLFFKECIGRTDLPGGNPKAIKESILTVLEKFENYNIYPGHGDPFILDSMVIANILKQL